MPKCSNCGTENNAGGKFCSECGSPLSADTKVCGACHNKISKDAKFCPHCQADQQYHWFTFTTEEVSFLIDGFDKAEMKDSQQSQTRTRFDVLEAAAINKRIEKLFPNERIIVFVPEFKMASFLREGSALDHLKIDSRVHKGDLIITNHRFILLGRIPDDNKYVLYSELREYKTEGHAKDFSVIFKTQKNLEYTFRFSTSARSGIAVILSASMASDHDRSQKRDDAGLAFFKTTMNLLKLIGERWN